MADNRSHSFDPVSPQNPPVSTPTSTPLSSPPANTAPADGCNIGVSNENSRDFPEVRSVNFANIWLDGVIADQGGQVDMQVSVGLAMSHPNYAGGKQIWPCSAGDPNLGACKVISTCYGAYYDLPRYSATKNPAPLGIFINMQDANNCLGKPGCNNSNSIIDHRLPNKVDLGTLEIYPSDWDTNYKYTDKWARYGGVRVEARFHQIINGGVYSEHIGTIQMPYEGMPGVGNMNGFVYFGSLDNPTKPEDNRVFIDFFQNSNFFARSTTGHPLMGFSSLSNKSDGYWKTAPLYVGDYQVFIGDGKTRKKIWKIMNIHQLGQVLNIDLNQQDNCFGIAGECKYVDF